MPAEASVRGPRVDSLTAEADRIPTDAPKSDGTLCRGATILLVVLGRDAMAPQAASRAITRAARKLGQPGLVRMAASVVGVALWDLKARILGLPLHRLLGPVRERVTAYGSGGFTSYPDARLIGQVAGWAPEGDRAVKMKIGRDPAADGRRVAYTREAVGDGVALFVDANGAFPAKQALGQAEALAAHGGSRSRCRRTIWRVSGAAWNTGRPEWTSPLANTSTARSPPIA